MKHMVFPFCLQCRNRTRLVNQVSQPYTFLHKNFTQVYYLNHFPKDIFYYWSHPARKHNNAHSFFWKGGGGGEQFKAEEEVF